MFYEDPLGEKRDVIYARVSTLGQQKQGDLDRQVDYILSKCSDLKNVLVMKEIGSGLNSKRKKMLQLLDLIMEGKVNRICVTYKERLTRFGFEYIESICRHHGVEIVVMHDTIQKTVSEELAEDIMMLLASFSGKMYGLRSHKNKKGLENE
jgi:resolvase related protein